MEQTIRIAFFLTSILIVYGFNVNVHHVGQSNKKSRSSTRSIIQKNHNHVFQKFTNDKIHQQQQQQKQQKQLELQMGLFDFFQSRENDFVKLEKTNVYGPGPIIILYNVPPGIADDEIQDMIDDGMGINGRSSSSDNVKFVRLDSSDLKLFERSGDDGDGDGDGGGGGSTSMTVSEVLEKINTNELNLDLNKNRNVAAIASSTVSVTASATSSVPILYFSGTSNAQMMSTYNIIAREIYEETGGAANAACAKVVEPAMNKPFRQVIEEIAGDHTDAIQGQTV